MASLIYGNKLPLLQKGFRSRINDSEIVGKTLEGANASFGDILTVGTSVGQVKKSTASTDKFAGILCGTNIKMPRVYPAGQGVDVETEEGEALNCLVRGSIALDVSGLAAIAQEADAFVGASGKVALTGTIKIGKFTGVVEGEIVGGVYKAGSLAEVFIGR